MICRYDACIVSFCHGAKGENVLPFLLRGGLILEKKVNFYVFTHHFYESSHRLHRLKVYLHKSLSYVFLLFAVCLCFDKGEMTWNQCAAMKNTDDCTENLSVTLTYKLFTMKK